MPWSNNTKRARNARATSSAVYANSRRLFRHQNLWDAVDKNTSENNKQSNVVAPGGKITLGHKGFNGAVSIRSQNTNDTSLKMNGDHNLGLAGSNNITINAPNRNATVTLDRNLTIDGTGSTTITSTGNRAITLAGNLDLAGGHLCLGDAKDNGCL